LVAELVQSADANARVAVRVHPVDHPSFHTDIDEIVATVGHRLCHVMLPKVESLSDIDTAVKAIDQAGAQGLAVHALIELFADAVTNPETRTLVLRPWVPRSARQQHAL
jgi:citrate lyase subunit beta/citryl-CoA lyase